MTHLLLIGAHEPVLRRNTLSDLRIIDLEEQRLLTGGRVTLLRHLVARSADLYEFLRLDARLLRLRHVW